MRQIIILPANPCRRTTDEAGACLALLSKDDYGNSYFSIVMDSDTKENLYLQMNDLLSIINKKEL